MHPQNYVSWSNSVFVSLHRIFLQLDSGFDRLIIDGIVDAASYVVRIVEVYVCIGCYYKKMECTFLQAQLAEKWL